MKATYIVELHNVRVPHFLQDRDFTVYALQVCMVLDLVFLEDLDSDLQLFQLTIIPTFSPVGWCVPAFTFPKVPFPFVFPKFKRMNDEALITDDKVANFLEFFLWRL